MFSQISAEAWISSPVRPRARFTQLAAEAWVAIPAPNRAWFSQLGAEAWVRTTRPRSWFTQLAVEAWVITRGLGLTYPVYPDLPGLGYSVSWKPEFANAAPAMAANKARIDLALASTPVHEFTLTYEFLRNQSTFLLSPLTNEFKALFGFFLRLGANAGRFVFKNPDDYTTTDEVVGTTDGVAVRYGPIQRTFGVGDNVGIEPVGYVNTDEDVHVYLDGVEADPLTYEIDRTYPLDQKIHFFVAPAADQEITIDCSYYYYCMFKEDNLSFEKFMQYLWTVKQVDIRSNRGGA